MLKGDGQGRVSSGGTLELAELQRIFQCMGVEGEITEDGVRVEVQDIDDAVKDSVHGGKGEATVLEGGRYFRGICA